MIERLIKNELTLKRWRRFKKIKRSVVSAWIIGFLLLLSATAEMWANNKPIIMSYKGSLYIPVYSTHHPSEFGQTGFVTNYRDLKLDEGDWAIWPPIKWEPLESNRELYDYPSPPSSVNWLGTDDRGRDVLSRLIYGFRYSFTFAIAVWFLSYLVGILVGALQGFAGGKTDLIGQRVVEVFEAMPTLLLLITLVSIFGATLWLLVLFSALFGWMMICQYERAEFLKLRKREFVEAARAQGVSTWRIILKHVLPNGLSPVLTFSPFTIAQGVYSLAILDFLGFGLPPPTPSWGELLQQAQSYFTIAWWLAVFPSVAMVVTLFCLNTVGEGIRDAFDPRK